MLPLCLLLVAAAVIRNRVEIDRWVLTRRESSPHPGEEEVLWIRNITGALRAGTALDDAIRQSGPQKPEWISPPLLEQAARSGTPVLGALSHLRSRLESRIRGLRKAKALTAQARAQSATIAALPWFLLAAWWAIDPRSVETAATLPWCWMLWGGALTLSAASLFWMNRMVARACLPSTPEELLAEEYLPPAILSLLGQVSAGVAVDEAAAQASSHLPPSHRSSLTAKTHAAPLAPEMPLLRETAALLARARRDGTPIRAELEAILADLDSRRDARMETALQKLPLRALLPLFLCSFPAAALVLTTLILPLLTDLA